MKALVLRALALLVALAVASPAIATAQQDTVRKESPGQVMKTPTYASVVAAVNATADAATKLAGISAPSAEQIHLVDASTFVNESNEAEFNAAVEKNAQAIEALRAALQKNDVITKAFADHPAKPALADVVGAEVGPDNDVTIYYRKKA